MGRALMLGCLLCLSLGLGAAQYKWTDADGQVHYTQSRPPAGVEFTIIGPPPKPASAPAKPVDQAKKMEEFEARRKARLEEQATAKKEKQISAKQKEICEQLAKNLTVLKTRNTAYKMVDGQRVVMSQDERQQRLNNEQKRYDEECRGQTAKK